MKDSFSDLKDDFSSMTNPFIFTSVASELFDWSNKPAWIFPALNQQAAIYPSLEYFVGQIQVQKPTLAVTKSQAQWHLEQRIVSSS